MGCMCGFDSGETQRCSRSFTTVGGKAKGMGTSSSKATEVTDGTEAERGETKTMTSEVRFEMMPWKR